MSKSSERKACKVTELECVEREMLELRLQIAQAEKDEARSKDLAVVEASRQAYQDACDKFDAVIAGIHDAWVPIRDAVNEAEEIIAFLQEASRLGRYIKNPPSALQNIFIPESLKTDFIDPKMGFSGLALLVKRMNEGKYVNLSGDPLSRWLYSQGLRRDGMHL